MKKLFAILLMIFVFCSCGKTNETASEKNKEISREGEESSAKQIETAVDEEISSEENEKKAESSSLKGKVIVVDAGHGLFEKGRTEPIAPGSSEKKAAFVTGTSGKNQSEEELNLSVACKLKTALEEKGAVVHMTRETHETTRSNVDRAEFANELGADISVKLHADGSENPSSHGASMLVPGSVHIKEASVVEKSRNAGELVLAEYIEATGAVSNGVFVRNDMTGFNWSKVPVILLEMGFMTNPEEDAMMEKDEYQDKMVEGIVSGLELYFEQ